LSRYFLKPKIYVKSLDDTNSDGLPEIVISYGNTNSVYIIYGKQDQNKINLNYFDSNMGIMFNSTTNFGSNIAVGYIKDKYILAISSNTSVYKVVLTFSGSAGHSPIKYAVQ
jgi:hypothetical protein